MRVAALVCAVLSAGSAHAASISIESTGPDPVVVVQGSFEGKDGEQFFTKTGSLSAAIIRLESNGGSLVAGIQIGETIRLKGFQTLVPAGARCASACAMAWLGGRSWVPMRGSGCIFEDISVPAFKLGFGSLALSACAPPALAEPGRGPA